MSGGSTTVEHIDAVDAFARTLFMRAKQISGPSFTDAATAVRQLHLSLRHLRIEAADQDSLLNNPDAAGYARQLPSLIENCNFALEQLSAILDKHGNGVSTAECSAVKDKVASVATRLTQEHTNVARFLDTIQLHNPANPPQDAHWDESVDLEDIKNKVDKVAKRVFKRQGSGLSEDSDRTWREFKTELEKEGFAPNVLRQHKDVLRAYIRELESASCEGNGSPPTFQGMLEYEANTAPQPVQPPTVPPKIPLTDGDTGSRSDKFQPAMRSERRHPDEAPAETHTLARRPSSPEDMAIISTRDLISLDALNHSMAMMHIEPVYNQRPNPPERRYLTAGPHDDVPAPSANFSTSPSFYSYTPNQSSRQRSPPRPASPGLAPDRYGNKIPIDAQWTKIRRTLVSPEALARAGVRYEARPEYVAVLGRLTKEEVMEFARQSAECRASRAGSHFTPRRTSPPRREYSWNTRHDDGDDQLYDSTDDDEKLSSKGTKSYPYIVSPPEKTRTSPNGSTVKPKPILKNKNENHVHFGPDPYEVDPRGSPPRKDKDGRRIYAASSSSSSSHRRRRDDDRDNRRDDDRYRRSDNDRRSRDERNIRKKSIGETIGAVSIGGAAVSLLTVLAHAAVGV